MLSCCNWWPPHRSWNSPHMPWGADTPPAWTHARLRGCLSFLSPVMGSACAPLDGGTRGPSPYNLAFYQGTAAWSTSTSWYVVFCLMLMRDINVVPTMSKSLWRLSSTFPSQISPVSSSTTLLLALNNPPVLTGWKTLVVCPSRALGQGWIFGLILVKMKHIHWLFAERFVYWQFMMPLYIFSEN